MTASGQFWVHSKQISAVEYAQHFIPHINGSKNLRVNQINAKLELVISGDVSFRRELLIVASQSEGQALYVLLNGAGTFLQVQNKRQE